MKKKIIIDGREFVAYRRTGIGRFLEGLLLALTNAHPDFHCEVVVNQATDVPLSLQGKVDLREAPNHIEWHWPSMTRGFDLFISPYPKLPIRKLSCSSIHTIHDVFYLTHPAYQGNTIRRFTGLWRLKRALRNGSLTWFDSQASQLETEKLTGKISNHAQIRFPSIESGFKLDGRIKRKDFYLFVGNGLPHKNVQTLLAALKDTSAVLKCVGIQPDLATKLQTLYQLNVKQVDFLQGVDDVELLKLYRQCQALVQPSTAEGYGYPPLEAMACGAPAIVSDIPVLRETTGGFATFCPALDVSAWRDTLTSFTVDAQQRDNALLWTKQHQGEQGWAVHINDIEKLLNN
ncbi:MAG: glycosyltransferase family 1 protein [Ghiorsea sp.]